MNKTVSCTLLCLLSTLTACQPQNVQPTIPKIVTVVVKQMVPVPAWASDPLPKPVLADSSVAAHLSRENALNGFADVLLCERALLAQLGQGKAVDPKTCEVPSQ